MADEAAAAERVRGPARYFVALNGYSGADLSSARAAFRRGEITAPRRGAATPGPIELRVHGVGGASASDNLETPCTMQVAGDRRAGFHRAWHPGGTAPSDPDRQLEAYSWGAFSYASVTSALWILLLPFALVNLAGWALPAPPQGDGSASGALRDEGLRRWSRGTLRLLGLVLTAAFASTSCYLAAIVVAPRVDRADWVPGWLGSGRLPVLGLALVTITMLGLWLYGRATARSYEDWTAGDGVGAAAPVRGGGMRLSDEDMWKGARSGRQQRVAHGLASCAVVLAYAYLGAVPGTTGATAALGGTVLMVVGAAVALALVGGGALPDWAIAVFRALGWAGWVVTAGVLAVVAWGSSTRDRDVTAERELLLWVVAVEVVLLVVLLVLLLLQRAWRSPGAMLGGFLTLLFAALAVAVSTIFGSALLLTATGAVSARTTGGTDVDGGKTPLPVIVEVGSAAFAAAAACALAAAVGLLVLWRLLRRRHRPHVLEDYPPGVRAPGGRRPREAERKVAGYWATAAMTDWAPVAAGVVCLGATVVLAIGVLTGFAAAYPDSFGWFDGLDGARDVIRRFDDLGGGAAVAAVGLFVVLLRSALLTAEGRRRFGFFWDVVNFWPRKFHPFAPPSYAERAVPELVTRVRRLAGDDVLDGQDAAVAQAETELGSEGKAGGRTTEPHRSVLLVGYSQGAPMSVAAVAQLLSRPVVDRVALLLLASPVHRLYGRAFPLYFGPRELAILADELTAQPAVGGPAAVRWHNLNRRTDYIGGPVGLPQVDRRILDPPTLWVDEDPTPPEVHRHSDLFPDPQVRPFARKLRDLLP